MSNFNFAYGWKKQLPDFRDISLKIVEVPEGSLPDVVDLTSKCPPVYNQLALGSCTANAIAAAYQFDLIKQGAKDFNPSRLFIYYNERMLEGTVSEDSGATIRDSAKVINQFGVCHEALWPYNTDRFKQKPFKRCYNEGLTRKSTTYQYVPQDAISLRNVLAKEFPVVIGISVYESFESEEVAKTGIVPMPGMNESLLGGHAVLLIGYDIIKRVWICRNSWGYDWGMNGYFTLPYEYLTNPNLAGDFWVVQTVK